MTKISTTSGNDGFSIEATSDLTSGNKPLSFPEAVGRIKIGSFMETFLMDLSFWPVDEYRRSWENALQRLERCEKTTSCLIASITDPEASNFISCWPLYRDRSTVYVQNLIIFLEELDKPFNPQEPWQHIGPRRSIDEDGNHISEWVTSMSQVRQFRESNWNL